MPPKSKRERHVAKSLELAREAKRTRVESEEGCGACAVEVTDKLEDLVESADALDTDDEEKDPTFELESSMVSDNDFMAETFCEDWVSHLGKEDLCVSGRFPLLSGLQNTLHLVKQKLLNWLE